jgi:hypothetical protein
MQDSFFPQAGFFVVVINQQISIILLNYNQNTTNNDGAL